jgi:heme/copper-type cytochrome/quinol oxidase subunit 4
MNQNNRPDFSLKNKKRVKEKTNGNYKLGQWLRLSHWNRFGYLTLTAFIFTIVVTFLSSAWLPRGESVAYSALTKETNERLILAQEETQQPREENQDLQKQIEEPATEGEVQREEPATEGEVQREEPATEGEVQREEPATEGEAQSEEKLPFEEAKKSLEEEIDEIYEEWKSHKKSSEISHAISAITMIVITIFIILLGTGLVELPYKKLIIVILGIITVLIQLNTNIFLLEKSLAGYDILAEQGLTLKSKVASVKTDEELTELREQVQELILESIQLE